MGGSRRVRLLRYWGVRLALLVGVQIPAIAGLAHVVGSTALGIALACALSAAAIPELRHPWDPRPRRPARLVATLAFYAWWVGCLVFLVLAPVALAAAAFTPLGRADLFAAAGALAALGGLRAIWPRPRLVRRAVEIPGLPAVFDGYRIAQLSDVHCGPYTPARRVRRWVERVNRLEADIVAITGDLIASGSLHVRPVSKALGGLSARDGVFACLGNHEYFTDAEAFVRELEGAGVVVLRNRGVPIGRGEARLFVAGVDDTWTGRADVARALASRPEGAATVLLAHDPNLFPEAASHGVELTLSGHTHGGQLGIPGLARRWNLARLITRFPAGLYRAGRAALYVSRGAGTSGPPIRLGAPPEITIFTLRAA